MSHYKSLMSGQLCWIKTD